MRFREAKIAGASPRGHIIALSGMASPQTQSGVKAAGASLLTGISPGPLK